MAVPVPESFTATVIGNGTTFNMPATRPDGRLYVLHVTSDDELAVTAPEGWNTVAALTDNVGNTAYMLVAWRIGDNEPATYDVGGSPDTAIAVVSMYSGVDQADPINQAATPTSGTGTLANSPAVTPDVDDTLILRLFSSDGAAFTSLPFTELYNETGSADARAALSHEAGPASGNSSGPNGADLAASDQWMTTTLAIAPGESGPTPESTSLFATDTQTIEDVVNENDNTTDLHLSVDDDPATPNDDDWVNNAVDVT